MLDYFEAPLDPLACAKASNLPNTRTIVTGKLSHYTQLGVSSSMTLDRRWIRRLKVDF